MNKYITETHDLVARVCYDGGVTHDMQINHLMDEFLNKNSDIKSMLEEDGITYCYFVRLEEKGTWAML